MFEEYNEFSEEVKTEFENYEKYIKYTQEGKISTR